MKKMRKMILTVAAVAVAVVSAEAQQQPTYVQGFKSYSFVGANASGAGDISYQWYRNGNPIPNATGKDYVLPVKQAYGANVEFKRGAMSNSCAGEVSFSNVFYLTFSGLKIDTLCWAHTNVDAPNTFALWADMYTPFYQWNSTTAWPFTGSVSNWNTTADQSATWTHNPCPSGWRLPTNNELTALDATGSTYVTAATRGNRVLGRYYGPNNATCSLPSNMAGCIFLPAVGRRNAAGAPLYTGVNGLYWSSTQNSATNGYYLSFGANSLPSSSDSKAFGMSVRCVQ